MGRPTVFNGKVLQAITKAIERGAFEWVAAEAAGINRKTLYRWIKRGEEGEEPFAMLVARMEEARAKTRIGAESRVREENPLSWLRLGPGRERRGRPGWTNAVEAQPEESREEPVEEEDPAVVEAIAEALNEVGWEESEDGPAAGAAASARRRGRARRNGVGGRG